MINLQNPSEDGENGGLSLSENRVYFGLWALIKAPLILSANLPTLSAELIAMANNTEGGWMRACCERVGAWMSEESSECEHCADCLIGLLAG